MDMMDGLFVIRVDYDTKLVLITVQNRIFVKL